MYRCSFGLVDMLVINERPRLWQWPTVLSLDAPIVVITWQLLLAQLAGVALDWPRVAVLGLSVWLAYVADRWLEAVRLGAATIRTPRHHFYYRHRRAIVAIWAGALAIDLWMALTGLTSQELLRGTVLLATVLAYVVSHQYLHRTRQWRAPKEVCIAMLLTGGVAVFLSVTPAAATLVEPLACFAVLCFTNCALISTWERDVDLTHGQTSLALESDGAAGVLRSLPWFAAMLAVLVWWLGPEAARIPALCALGSAVLLGVIDRLERRAGWQIARVLADVALLTPLVPLLWGLG